MDKTKIRILIAKYIDDRLDEWEEATSMSGLETLLTVTGRTASLRLFRVRSMSKWRSGR